MRVEGAAVVLVGERVAGRVLLRVLLCGREQRGVLGGVDDVVGARQRDGVVDRGLEAGQVDDEIGAVQPGDLRGGELDVVRLGAGRRQRADRDAVAAHLLGDELQGVERRHDVHGPVGDARLRVGGAPGERRPDQQHGDDQQRGEPVRAA